MKTLRFRHMLVRVGSHFLAAVALAPVAVAPALAQRDRGNPGWYVRATQYVWFSNLGGAETLGFGEADNILGDLVVPVGDTLLETSWATRIEVGKGRVRGWVNLASADFAKSTEVHPVGDPSTLLDADFDFSWLSADVFGAVQIGPFRSSNAVDLYGGVRYVKVEHDLEVVGRSPASAEETWVDPVVGGRYFTEMGGRFWAVFNGDLGGFGVGSRFTLTLGGELGFRLVRPLDISLRYNYQEVEYDNGQDGAGAFVWENGVVQGWFFGAVLKL